MTMRANVKFSLGHCVKWSNNPVGALGTPPPVGTLRDKENISMEPQNNCFFSELKSDKWILLFRW